jgi:perosamine synthetase
MYTVMLKDTVQTCRDEVIAALQLEQIETRPVFYPMHVMPPYAEEGVYPNAVWCGERGLSLPTHGGLTDQDLDRVVAALGRAVGAA